MPEEYIGSDHKDYLNGVEAGKRAAEELLNRGAGKRYFVSSDNSGHEYFVEWSRKSDWDAWRELDEDDEASWEEPEYAERINGGTLTFTNPKIERRS